MFTDKSSEEGLLLWVKNVTDGYKGVHIENFKTRYLCAVCRARALPGNVLECRTNLSLVSKMEWHSWLLYTVSIRRKLQ
jgi:hypothetical protein